MSKLNISILGCGWLGLPLLKSLVEDGHVVKGSSRNPKTLAEIQKSGGQAFLIDLPQGLPTGFTDGCNVLIITLPPGGRKFGAAASEKYIERLRCLASWFKEPGAPAIIFTSSTGVYGAAREGVTTERNRPAPSTHSAIAVLEAEQWLEGTHHRPLTILRLAGLIAEDRHPGHFFGGKDWIIPEADMPVNLIHRTDVITAIKLCLRLDGQLPNVFNVCAAAHPTKGDFYTRAANALGLKIKGAKAGGEKGKIVNSEKLRNLGWKPVWDDLELTFLKNKTNL